jgi:uncharacterized repeat protein (TIGR03803 family)
VDKFHQLPRSVTTSGLQATGSLARLNLVFACVLLVLSAGEGQAQVYEKVFSFTDARTNGFSQLINKSSAPVGSLIQGNDGNFYGTTSGEGANDLGTVFKMTPAGALTTLVAFTGVGGSNKGGDPTSHLTQSTDGTFYGTTPGTVFQMTSAGVLTTLVEFAASDDVTAGLILANDGNFYGTTGQGGATGNGTVFKMTPTGTLTTLVEFTGNGASNKGSFPFAGLVQGSDGNFYGTTVYGGASGNGTVFKVTAGGALTTLVEFTGNGAANKGSNPYGGLVQGVDGNFYGTTSGGGSSFAGTVFKVTPAGVLTTLVEFNGSAAPQAGLILGSDGNFYGTTAIGGANGLGTVFKMSAGGTITTLVDFTGNGATNRGNYPESALFQGSDGNFYGTTRLGGANNLGTVFRMTPTGALTTLVDFNGSSSLGRQPYDGVVPGSDGNFYGTTSHGGANDLGTVFKMTPAGVLTTLVQFTGMSGNNKGESPQASLLSAGDGNFYGTTSAGGATNAGTIFKMTPGGVLTTLVEFTPGGSSNQGEDPYGRLVQGSDGNFYGTTLLGPGTLDPGTVFKMTPAGVLTTLVAFTGNGPTNKGIRPYAGLLQASDGNFYGTTSSGATYSGGTVFKMTPAGVLTTLVEFTNNQAANTGAFPQAALVQGNDGNLYGTTAAGGVTAGNGTIFKMTFAGSLTTLVEFSGNGASNKGSAPYAGLVQASDGNFYGTTTLGGANNSGTIFKMSAGGVLTTIYDFSSDPSDAFPYGTLVAGPDGNLYGTTSGFPSGDGGIYRLIFPGTPGVYPLDPQPQGGGSALLQCKVNARGAATTVTLEYGTDGVNFPNSVSLSVSLNGFQTTLLGTTLTGLQPGGVYYYRFRAINSFGTTLSSVGNFTVLAPATAAVTNATQLTQTSATLNGTVNALNYDATVHFEYGTDGNSFPNQVAAVPATVSGNTNTAVSAAVAGLTKGTTYYYRIVATNVGGTTVSGVSSFVTLTEPTATIGAAVALSTISAQVNGSANARGSNTQVSFEYGTDGTTFPNSVSAIPSTVSGNNDTAVTAALHSLAQGTTYYYRIRATSAGGVGVSATASFSLNILSGLTQVFPGAPPSAQGFVIVTLTPSAIQSGWRFVGEQLWRASGTVAGGLTTGDRQIEFPAGAGLHSAVN